MFPLFVAILKYYHSISEKHFSINQVVITEEKMLKKLQERSKFITFLFNLTRSASGMQ